MPNPDPTTTLHAVFTFYSEILTLTSEGDSVVSEETLQGIGTTTGSLLDILFGSILRIASPNQAAQRQDVPPISSPTQFDEDDAQPQVPPLNHELASGDAAARELVAARRTKQASTASSAASGSDLSDPHKLGDTEIEPGLSEKPKSKNSVLIRYLPDPGYFVAGAVAGGISRTATAPLDRLKVYLLVNTRSASNLALDAAKKGRPLQLLLNAGKPLITAVTDLYKSGGLRGFFAGTSPVLSCVPTD
jgi:solute carrier family 25 (mitochondrial phosphate transporter), member 23/24/25/41